MDPVKKKQKTRTAIYKSNMKNLEQFINAFPDHNGPIPSDIFQPSISSVGENSQEYRPGQNLNIEKDETFHTESTQEGNKEICPNNNNNFRSRDFDNDLSIVYKRKDNEDEGHGTKAEEDDNKNDEEDNEIHCVDINDTDNSDADSDNNYDDERNSSGDINVRNFASSAINDTSVSHFPLWSKQHLTTKDHLLATVAISMRHHLTYEAMLDILKWANVSHIADNLPTHKDALWKALHRDDFNVTYYYYYCKVCNGYLGAKSEETNELQKSCPCGLCGPEKTKSNLGYFIYMKLETQIQQLLTNPNIIKALQYRYNRKKKCSYALGDIYDGAEYRKLCSPQNILENKYNLSLTMNTDGCQTSKSSKSSAWPIYAMINELPPHLRKKYMLLSAIYVDTKHPLMNNYLEPFMDEMRTLYDEGIHWKLSETVDVNSKVIVTTCCFDSPAKAAVTNLRQHNGHYGCLYCYIPGKSLGRGKLVYPITSVNLRTDEELRKDMKHAFQTGNIINGVKNVSSLIALPSFNITKGVVIDAMHAIFLGVIKQHTVLLLTSTKTPYYVGDPNSINIINNILLSIKPPSRRARKPRSIEDYKNYKATEWRNWLDYAPACLEEVLDKEYIKHFALLSEAIHYLNGSEIQNTELDRAEKLLEKYVSLFQKYFGISNMTSNIHALTHLVQDVKNWGPIWTHSAFVFESWNKKIMDLLTSSHAQADQVVTRFFMQKYIYDTVHHQDVAEETKNFIQKTTNINIENCQVTSQHELILRGKLTTRTLIENELTLLTEADFHPENIKFFSKMRLNGVEYRCNQKSKALKFCDSIIYYKDGFFGVIESIVEFNSNEEIMKGIFVKKYEVVGFAFDTKHIYKVKRSESLDFLTKFDEIKPAFEMSVSKTLYIMKIPNCYETD